ncbi:MAG: PfkB family carbohydrate kinase, partial [Atopobiaceae bacterium]|nr:PfkB family carbohydrate kinase [Atopobiaceae bacterium]
LSPGANHALVAADVSAALDDLAEYGDVFLTQLECDPETTFAAIREAHGRGLYTIVNPAPAQVLPEGLLGCVDLVCVNETECHTICGVLPTDDETCLAASDALMGQGATTVVVTLGSHGAFARDASQALAMPALPAEVVDTTCAGDTFLGSLVASHLAGIDLAEAMGRATCASSIAVSRLGAQRSIPSLVEVDRLFDDVRPRPRTILSA